MSKTIHRKQKTEQQEIVSDNRCPRRIIKCLANSDYPRVAHVSTPKIKYVAYAETRAIGKNLSLSVKQIFQNGQILALIINLE